MLKLISTLAIVLVIATAVVSILLWHVRRIEKKRHLSEERFELAVTGSNDGIWDWDITNNKTYFSPRFNNMLGITNETQSIDNPITILKQRLHPDDRDHVIARLKLYLKNGKNDLFVSEHRIRKHDGIYIWVLMRARAQRDMDGKAVRISGSVSDVTHRKHQEAKIKYQALHDALTGLPNRSLLMERLQNAVKRAKTDNGKLALIIMDLDRFKEINDTLGHQVGDQVLRQAAERLQRILRKSDIVVRLGGDEFAVLLPVGDEIYAKHVAEKILLAFNKVFDLGHHHMYVGSSLGIALFPNHGRNVETLIRHADVAMYVAKRANRGYTIYNIEEDPHSLRRLALEKDLHDAIDNDRLTLHYQPKVDLGTGSVVGVEALLRWMHPTQGEIPPSEAIPIAEQTGLIKPLLSWVLEKSLSQLASWRKNNINLSLSVNISAWNLTDPALIETLRSRLCEWNIPPSSLELEITESAMMADPERAMKVLTGLEKMGISLAIDDFGTGFSSLTYLKRLPVSCLKIDKSFVKNMTVDNDDVVIVQSTIDLAHNLKLHVVAEGVENEKTLNQLAALGCETAQGYYISSPLSADNFTRWLHESPWGMEGLRRLTMDYPAGSYKTH
ncbi:MAG: EAL domain-containing protein, partial [Gammaproteobacteria bacterium]|nr:EAL domain-containing protein [Gammaproteobacteria bacterium]